MIAVTVVAVTAVIIATTVTVWVEKFMTVDCVERPRRHIYTYMYCE